MLRFFFATKYAFPCLRIRLTRALETASKALLSEGVLVAQSGASTKVGHKELARDLFMLRKTPRGKPKKPTRVRANDKSLADQSKETCGRGAKARLSLASL